MILCIDVGNSHIYGGVFIDNVLKLRFRHTSTTATSDELGIFLKNVLRENQMEPNDVEHIAICSVVPQMDYSLRAACVKYFNITPFYIQAGVKTGLNIKYRNPLEVGADRIANAIAVTHEFPKQNTIIIDYGTATTVCVVDNTNAYLGGAIFPGVRLSVDALSSNTAKLPSVEIVKPSATIGRSTIESLQSGIYYAILGASRELIQDIKQTTFNDQDVTVIATGGFAWLFEGLGIYDHHFPDLVLQGLYHALKMNAL